MPYKTLAIARNFARTYFHDARIYKDTTGKFVVIPASAKKPYKSWKFIERVSDD